MKFLFPHLFFLLLSGLIVFSWFRFGYIYGGGDVGLQTYDPLRIVEITKYIWWEATAPGSVVPQGLTALPFNFAFSLLQKVSFTPVMLQASLFFLILFFMGLGMYYLIIFILGKEFKKYAVLGALFYMLNPYMMIQVWHRFVHSTFFLAASLPFLVIFWMRWIKTGKLSNLILFLFINLLALYLYGTIAFIITVWLILFLITLGEGIFPWQGFKEFIRIAGKFLLGGFLWLLTNIWWLIPIFTISPSLLSEQHTTEGSLGTLINISRQAIIPYSLQMVNPFYLFLQQDFGSFYQNFLVRLLPWLFVSVILIGLLAGLKQKGIVKWSFIFIIILFLAKGASSPFGQAFIFGFENFFPLGVLRNPFEKIGILLPFVGAILFAQGFLAISNFSINRIGKKFVIIPHVFILLLIIIFHWPMFNPGIFGKIDKPAFVKVPASYIQANEWIKNDLERQQPKVLGKILHLPLTRGESISYKWEHGYQGIEPSALFFTSLPSIARGFNIKRVDDSLTALSLIFHIPNSEDPQKILKLLQDFNVRYIILHKDVSWLGGDLYDPIITEGILNNLPFLERTQTFGDLAIYKVSDDYFKPKITLSSNFQLVYPSDTSFIWPWLIGNSETMITPVEQQLDEKNFKMASQIIVFPKSSSVYPKEAFILLAINQIAADEGTKKFLLAYFTKAKPALIQNGEIQSEKLNDKLISSTEKILYSSSRFPIEDYRQELNDIFSKDLRKSRLLLYVNEKDISLIFQIHLIFLKMFSERSDPTTKVKLDETYKFLQEHLVKNNFIPQNPLNLNSDQSADRQKVFHFQVPKDLKYEILIVDERSKAFLKDNLDKFKLSINGQKPDLKIQEQGKSISLGSFDFKAGFWELGYESLVYSNLTASFDQLFKVGNVKLSDDAIKIEPVGPYGFIGSLIPNAKGGDIYRISFEVLSQDAAGIYFQVAQDVDPVDSSGQQVNINEFIDLSQARTNWQSFIYTLLPLKLTAQQAGIKFVIPSNGQLPPASFLIKNLKIERVLSNDLVLKGILNETKNQEDSGQLLSVDQKSPVFYEGKINVKNPNFLIFSETFHPGWKLKLTNGKKTFYPQKHYMANLYANAWFIEDTGEYDFSLEFEPQRIVNIGAIVAALSYFTIIVFTVWKSKRI